MRKMYNKLVRDNIPEICLKNGETPVVAVLNENEFEKMLNEKLREETAEFLESGDTEELADILEVVDTIASNKGISFEELIEIKENKAKKNGKFMKKILLKEVID